MRLKFGANEGKSKMADSVTAQVVGGETRVLEDMDTVKEVRKALGLNKDEYAATVKGEPADEGDELEDFDFVSFAPKVRGGR